MRNGSKWAHSSVVCVLADPSDRLRCGTALSNAKQSTIEAASKKPEACRGAEAARFEAKQLKRRL